MNIAKHMEVIFAAAAVVAAATSFATAADGRVDVILAADTPAVVAHAHADAAMPVVTVSAKRLTAAEKAAL